MRRRIYEAATPDDAQRTYHGLDFWAQGNPGNFGVVASYTLAFSEGTVTDYFSAFVRTLALELALLRRTVRQLSPHAWGCHRLLVRLLVANVSAHAVPHRRPAVAHLPEPGRQQLQPLSPPRGTNIGARSNDPTVWSEFKLPDQFTIDLQGSFSLEKLLGQRIDLMVMITT